MSSDMVFSQAPEIIWQHSYGGSSWDQANAVRQTPDGGYAVAGYTRSTDDDVLFNHGIYDYWLLRLDTSGNVLWQKSYGGSGYDYCYDMQVTPDGGFVLAGIAKSTDGDITETHGDDYWIVKTDVMGNIEWQKCYGGSSSDYAHRIALTDDGGYIIAGESSSNDGDVSGNHGGSDYWVAKIDAAGELQWQACFGSEETEDAKSIIQVSDGGYIVAGYTNSEGGGDVTWGYGSSDYWIIKLDDTGNLLWEKSFGGSNTDIAHDLAETPDSGFFITAGETLSYDYDITGFHGGLSDCWVIKLDSSGNLLWQKSIGGSDAEGFNSISITSDSCALLTGYSQSSDFDATENNGGADLWAVKVDTVGNILWQRSIGGSELDRGYSVIQSDDGNFVVAGYSRSSDYDVTENNGDFDYWIVKLGFCTTHYYADADGDGFGNILFDSTACSLPAGYVTDSTDCNDADHLIYPTAEDICNTIDDNCNGAVDEDAAFTVWYADMDGDNFGDVLNDSLACSEPGGFVLNNTDCNDTNASVHPDATEICNALDDNCNIAIDEGLPIYTFFEDADGDGFGNIAIMIISCMETIAGFVPDSTDCDDTNELMYPGAEEICNYLDDDCDGVKDDNLSYIHSYADADNDDYGNMEIDSLACDIPEGYVTDNTDCDDTNPDIYPGAPEILNGLDDDCDEQADEGLEINQTLLEAFTIYPNPAEDDLHIEYTGNETVFLEMITTTGQTVYTNTFANSFSIDVSVFASGLYFLKIKTDNGEAGIKFVKE